MALEESRLVTTELRTYAWVSSGTAASDEGVNAANEGLRASDPGNGGTGGGAAEVEPKRAECEEYNELRFGVDAVKNAGASPRPDRLERVWCFRGLAVMVPVVENVVVMTAKASRW